MLEIESVHDAVEVLSLVNVEFEELAVQRLDPDDTPVEEAALSINLGAQYRVAENVIGYRIRTSVTSEHLNLEVIAVVTYEASAPIKISDLAVEDFANKVAFMTTFPYIRQAVSDMSTRIGLPVTLPVMPAGQVSFKF